MSTTINVNDIHKFFKEEDFDSFLVNKEADDEGLYTITIEDLVDVLHDQIEKILSNYITEEFKINISDSLKLNEYVEKTMVVSFEKRTLSPSFRLNHIYSSNFCDKEGDIIHISKESCYSKISNILMNIVDILLNADENPFASNGNSEPCNDSFFTKVLKPNKIYAVLVNYDSNKSYLQDKPHRRIYNDLALFYKVLVNETEEDLASITITDVIAEDSLGLNEEEIYNLALYNTRILFPCTTTSVLDALMSMTGLELEDEEAEDLDTGMILVTNNKMSYGAVNLIYPDVFKDIAKKFNVDKLIIIPSSIHELIVVPGELHGSFDETVENVSEMVSSITDEHVNQEDKLSKSVYYYDAIKNVIEVAASGEDLF